jgi:hypothetical protein
VLLHAKFWFRYSKILDYNNMKLNSILLLSEDRLV